MIMYRSIRSLSSGSNLKCLAQNPAMASPLTSKARTIESLPGPPRIPGFGSYWIIKNVIRKSKRDKFYENQIDLQQRYGNYVNLSFGAAKMVMISCPKVMEEIIRWEDKGLPVRGCPIGWELYIKEAGIRPGLLTAHDQQWKENRRSVSALLLKANAFEAHVNAIHDIVTEFTDSLEHRSDRTGFVDEMPMKLMHLTHEVITQVLFGVRLNSSGKEPSQKASKFLQAINLIVADSFNHKAIYIYLMKKFNTKGWKQHKAAWDHLLEEARYFTNQAISSEEQFVQAGYTPLIFQLIERHDRDLFGTVSELLMGGVDTTSNLLGFILFKLAENPDKQDKLRAEVMKLGERKAESKYVKLVVKETARLFPVLTVWGRHIERDFFSDYSGIMFPKGTEIIFNHYAIFRDSANFEQPKQFIPERFDRENTTYSSRERGFISIPFGFGIRSCVGRRLAELEMNHTITDIVSKYKVELVEDMKLDPIVRGVLTPGKQLPVRFIPLQHNTNIN